MKDVKSKSKDNNKNKQDIHLLMFVVAGLCFAPYTYEAGVSIGGMFGRMLF